MTRKEFLRGMSSKTSSFLLEGVQLNNLTIKIMKPKITPAKEQKIEAVEALENAEKAEINDDGGLSKSRRRIPLSNLQKKKRAANKKAKVARKINIK